MFKILSTKINPTGTYSVATGTTKIYRVYKNPNARDLYIKAQNAATVEERTKLFEQMGDYEIVTKKEKTRSNNRIMQYLKGIWHAD